MYWSRKQEQLTSRSLRWQLGMSYAVLVIIVTALLTGLALRISSSITLAAESRQALAAVSGAATAFSEALTNPTADLAQVARQQSLACNGRVLWLNTDGTVRLDAFGPSELGGTRLDLPDELISGTTPIARVYNSADGWVTYATAPLPAAGLVVLVRDISHTWHDLARLRLILWLWGSFLACGFAALGFFYARSVTRPVERLTVAARQMQAGDLEQTVLPGGSNELRQLTSAFNAMAARVAFLDEQRRAFVANAAHELRTPLAALQALAYELQASRDSQKSTLAAFVRQTERLGRTVDSLLTLARLDNPDRAARMIPIRVRNLLLEVCWVMRPMVAQRSLELILPEELENEPWILADPDWLHLALVNILENSVRYTPPLGKIRIGVSSKRDEVAIQISDSGPGVPAEALAALGDRFFRVSHAREQSNGGSGLGLAIVREIVELHSGRLVFDSPPGQGLIVTIALTAIPEPENES